MKSVLRLRPSVRQQAVGVIGDRGLAAKGIGHLRDGIQRIVFVLRDLPERIGHLKQPSRRIVEHNSPHEPAGFVTSVCMICPDPFTVSRTRIRPCWHSSAESPPIALENKAGERALAFVVGESCRNAGHNRSFDPSENLLN